MPAIFPFFVTGLVTASGGAWNASIVAEYFHFHGQTYSTVGLGAVISSATDSGSSRVLLAATLVMAAMVVTINRFLWRRLYALAGTKYKLSPVDSLVPSDVRPAHHGYRAGYHRAPLARPMAERTRLAGLRKDGATLPVEIGLSPVPTASENFVLAVIRDASEIRPRTDLADLARDAATDRGTGDLLDRVVHRLFQVGLSLQTAASLPGDVVRERLSDALDRLDDVIHEIRDYAFTSGGDGGDGGHGGRADPLGTGWPVI